MSQSSFKHKVRRNGVANHSTGISTADAIQIVLTGKHATIAKAFASDKKMLDQVAAEHDDPVGRRAGVMAGRFRKP